MGLIRLAWQFDVSGACGQRTCHEDVIKKFDLLTPFARITIDTVGITNQSPEGAP